MTPQEYWNRPWKCTMATRFHGGTHTFESFEEALEYAKQQWDVNENDVVRFPAYQGIRSDWRATIRDRDETVEFSLFWEYFS